MPFNQMHVFLALSLTLLVVAFPELSLNINRSLKQLGYPFSFPPMHKSLNLEDPGILLASLSQLYYLFNFAILFLPLLFFFLIIVKVCIAQSCLTLCSPMDCSPPGSSVHGISQARILEWIAIPFSRVSSQPRDWTQVSCIAGSFFISWATREAFFFFFYL